jgi:hypothetical protein
LVQNAKFLVAQGAKVSAVLAAVAAKWLLPIFTHVN